MENNNITVQSSAMVFSINQTDSQNKSSLFPTPTSDDVLIMINNVIYKYVLKQYIVAILTSISSLQLALYMLSIYIGDELVKVEKCLPPR